MVEDLGGHLGDVAQRHPLEIDARLLFQAVHDRIAQAPLVPEVPVDGALAHPGALGDSPNGQTLPVADRPSVEELGTGHDDPLAGDGGLLTSQRPVVGPARRFGLGRLTLGGAGPRHVR